MIPAGNCTYPLLPSSTNSLPLRVASPFNVPFQAVPPTESTSVELLVGSLKLYRCRSEAAETVSDIVLCIPPKFAVRVVVPKPSAVTWPLELIVATLVLDELTAGVPYRKRSTLETLAKLPAKKACW